MPREFEKHHPLSPQPSGPGTGKASPPPGSPARAGKRSPNQLLAMGSAAVLAIYFAGYFRTRAAAQRFEGDGANVRRGSGALAPLPIATTAKLSSQSDNTPSANASVSAPVSSASNPDSVTAAANLTTIVSENKASTSEVPIPVSPTAENTATASTAALVSVTTVPNPAPPLETKSAAANNAPAAIPAAASITPTSTATVATTAAAKWKDGKFSGWGSCRHGDIEATIEIKDGRIISAMVSECRTRYSCDVIDKIVPQVVARQTADVDVVSGATQSSDAYYWAVTAALGHAKIESGKAQ